MKFPSSMQVIPHTVKNMLLIVSLELIDPLQQHYGRRSLRLNLKVCVVWREEMKHFKTMVNHLPAA